MRVDSGLSYINGENLEQIRQRYPLAEIVLYDDWASAKHARQNTPIVWDEITAERFDYWLGVLPPIEWRNGSFLVSEAADHCVKTGRPRYQACQQIGDRYFASSRPMTRVELRAHQQAVPRG